MPSVIGSFSEFNYRIWATGGLVSNVGTWIQRTAQAWLVMAQLTHGNATALGLVIGLQLGPQVVLLPLTGFAADHVDRRRLLFVTQTVMGLLALVLGGLTLCGKVTLHEVYLLALLLGCVTAFDSPARQAFVSELVGEASLSNAVALNSISFNLARMLGPAAAGLLIAGVGAGWAFVINGASFGAVLLALAALRTPGLHRAAAPVASAWSFADGFHYVARRPDLQVMLLMLFLVGAFGLNFPLFLAAMSVKAFHAGPTQYGVLSAFMAMGSVAGALLAARRAHPRFELLIVSATAFGVGCALAAITSSFWLFAAILVLVGISAQTFTTSSNSLVQLSTDARMRGRVVAILLAVGLGSAPVGACFVGWVADAFGPRWALVVAAVAGLLAALAGGLYFLTHRAFPLRAADRDRGMMIDET